MQPILIWRIMRRMILIAFLSLVAFVGLRADDVRYLTTAQFSERVFDYKNNKDWKFKGDKPCVIDFYTTWCGPFKLLARIME